MFQGVVGAELREWFRVNEAAYAGKEVWVGCSGNFTIETVLSTAERPPAKIISSDVSLYSTALGSYYTDQGRLAVGLKEGWGWLERYIGTDEDIAAAVIVIQEMGGYSSRRTAYHRRMWQHFVDNFAKYHRGVLGRIRKRKKMLNVSEYRAEDVKAIVRQVPKEAVFMSFMPFYTGGYARMFKIFDEVFEWNQPPYEVLDVERKSALVGEMVDSLQYIHIEDGERTELPLVASVCGGRNVPVYLYSNIPECQPEYYRRLPTKWKRPPYEILGPDNVIENKNPEVKIVELGVEEFAFIRDQQLNKNIIPAEPSWRYGVFLEDVLVGVLGWIRGHDGESYYLLADIPVRHNIFKRLSKLMCAIARTKHMGDILRQKTGMLWDTFKTTAFTQRPVSMKYRGVFELQCRNRKEGKLTYGSQFSWSLSKAVKKWKKWEKQAG